MSSSIDLNIDNYTMNDLIKFFKLNSIYSLNDLSEGEKHMSLQIISSDYKTNYKYELLNFIKVAKNILTAKIAVGDAKNDTNDTNNNPINNKNDAKTNKKSNQNQNQNRYDDIIDKNANDEDDINTDKDQNIGKIINPGAPHPALQTQHIPKNRTNAYNNDTRVTNYIINTLFRDDFEGSWATDCTFTLPKKLSNIISLTLSGIQYPNFGFTFANGKDTTTMYIYEETTNIEAVVTIPEGNYTIDQFPAILEQAINMSIVGTYDPINTDTNRFQVYINPYTHFTTILNTTNNFKINTTKGQFSKCPMVPKFFTPNVKTGISRQTTLKTLGYQIGFRQIEYSGAKSYTSESLYNASYSDYVYFVLNDYCNNQASNNYSLFQNQIFDNNILAIIPVTAPVFTSTFDNNSNFIYKTRNYYGPVNITKISIQLTNQFGFPINLYHSDYIFCLQTVDIYNNVTEFTSNNVSII
jgi:hypothetical protein